MSNTHPASFPFRLLALAGLAAMIFGAQPAAAQAEDGGPPRPQRAHTLKQPAQDGKVVGGMKRGTDAAGRGIGHAEDAARRGINRGAEAASAPIRRIGEAFGRRLAPGSGGQPTPPAVGPQGNGP